MNFKINNVPFIGEDGKYFYFYCVTNITNNKVYYGVHTTDNLNDGYMGSGKLIRRAISKYGNDKFEKEIIMFFNTRDDMFLYEKEFINEEFLQMFKGKTYNLKLGGDGGYQYALTKFKEKLKENPDFLKEKRRNYLDSLSKEDMDNMRERISIDRKLFWEKLRKDEDSYNKYIETQRINSKQRAIDNPDVFKKLTEASKKRWEDNEFKNKQIELRKDREGAYYSRFKDKYESIKEEFLYLVNTTLYDSDIVKYFKNKGIPLSFDRVINYFMCSGAIITKEETYSKDNSNEGKTLKKKTIINNNKLISIKMFNKRYIDMFNNINTLLNDKDYSDSAIITKTKFKSFNSLTTYLIHLGIAKECNTIYVDSTKINENSRIKKAMKTILHYIDIDKIQCFDVNSGFKILTISKINGNYTISYN